MKSINGGERDVETTESWEKVLEALCAKPKAVICIVGPKASGKSSFARELFQRKRESSCCFIETDLGRPEYIFPGVISAHNTTGECLGALYFGEDEPSQRPHEYLKQVAVMCKFATEQKYEYQIVNTHGWVTMGQGQDILEGLLLASQVTDVVEIVVSGTSLVRKTDQFTLHTLTPAISGRHRDSKETRNAKFALEFLRPTVQVYAVGWKQVKLSFPQDVIDRSLPFEFALLAINTSIVGMLSGEETDDPAAFLGIGLVSGIDMDSQSLLVATSLSLELVAKCTTLAMGTSNRIDMTNFPPQLTFPPTRLQQQDEPTIQQQQPYVTACKRIGFDNKRKAIVKRKRLEQ